MEYKLSYDTWGKEELQVFKQIKKNQQLTMSKSTEVFERSFSSQFKRKYSLMVNSGSSANLLAVASLFYKKNKPLKRGDEVIVPAISWSTTYSPLQQFGLKLKVIDAEKDSLNIDVNKILKHITKKTKMIVGVSILGNPAKLDYIERLCKKNNIYFLNDNCESLGAKIGNKFTSSYGDLTTHSFFFSHHISTVEGGMVSTDNFELYCIMNSLRTHGWTRNLPNKNPLTKKNYNNFENYSFILPGYNLRPNEIFAKIGLIQLKKLKKMIIQRRKNLNLFNNLFSNSNLVKIFISKDYDSSFSFPMILKDQNNKLLQKIFDSLRMNKIQFRSITGGNFNKHIYKKYFDYNVPEKLENANYFHNYGFFIGNSSFDLSSQLKRFHKILNNHK